MSHLFVIVVFLLFCYAAQSEDQCTSDIISILTNPADLTFYRMKDAWGDIPPKDIADGNLYSLGSPWECQTLGSSTSRSCTISTDLQAKIEVYSGTNTSSTIFPFKALFLCVSPACTEQNLIPSFESAAAAVGIRFRFIRSGSVKVTCMEEKKLSIGAILMITLLALIGFVGVVASVLDEWFESKKNGNDQYKLLGEEIQDVDESVGKSGSTFHEYVRVFSALRGARELVTVKERSVRPGEDDLSSLNGIRVLSLLWVMLGHTYLTILSTSYGNFAEFIETAKTFSFQFVSNAFFAVDTFFVLSGFLAVYLLYKAVHKSKGVLTFSRIGFTYLHRFLRITPTYLVVVGVYALLFKYFYDGPLWDAGMDYIESTCNSYWWRNILYIDNFFDIQDDCIAWGWYLANDMQFFLITPWMVLLWYNRPMLGHIAFTSITLASVLCCIVLTVHFDLNLFGPLSKLYYPKDSSAVDYQNYIYFKPWARIQAYLMGMLLGYVQQKYGKFVKDRMSDWRIVSFLFILALSLLMGPLFGLHEKQVGHTPSLAEDVFYIAFSRSSWGLGVALIVLLNVNGKGFYINEFLSMPVWVPFARMGLPAYLIHYLFVQMNIFGRWTVGYISDFHMVTIFFSIACFTYISAFFLTIFIENPLRQLEKRFLH